MTTYNSESRKIKLVTEKPNGDRRLLPFPFDVNSCKRAFTTRHVDADKMQTLISGNVNPKAGDLVLCQVTRLRQHCRIEQPNGRRSRMFVNDKIIVCYGDRYAPDQFESVVPDSLQACHLVAGGGVASLMRHKSPKVKPATEIQPLGLIGDGAGHVINLKDFNVIAKTQNIRTKRTPVILVAGSSMNAGKTTTVASLIKGLTADGYQVGAAKMTGTGSGGDLWHFLDAGSKTAIDFTDAGMATTYRVKTEKLVKSFEQMNLYLQGQNVDVIVVEVADGILQQETKKILESKAIQEATTAMYYSAGDSSSALFGIHWLQDLGYEVLGLSGVVSSNPLGSKEVSQSVNVPILTKKDMTQAGFGHSLYEQLNKQVNKLKVSQ